MNKIAFLCNLETLITLVICFTLINFCQYSIQQRALAALFEENLEASANFDAY